MRPLWTGLAIALLGAGPAAAQRTTVKGFPVAPDVTLRIQNLVGVTRVTGWDHDSIAVTAVIPAGGGGFYGGGRDRFAKMGIEGQDPSLTGPGSELDVHVPRGARVWVKSGSANVELTGLSAEVEVTSLTGSIRLDGAPRVATLETIDGDLTITGAATVIRARTGSGAVRIRGARADISISTIQGPVVLASDELLSARIETVSGRVEVRAGMQPDGLLEIQAHDGEVFLSMPSAIDARFDLSTLKGILASRVTGQGSIPAGARSARFAVGKKAGAGRGAGITVRTFSGSIQVDSNLRPE